MESIDVAGACVVGICKLLLLACDVTQEFEDARDADDAVYDLNGKVLCGERYLIDDDAVTCCRCTNCSIGHSLLG